jgi:hypothetical protein
VNTTVERKIAGVASSTVGEDTERSVRVSPVLGFRLATSQLSDPQRL